MLDAIPGFSHFSPTPTVTFSSPAAPRRCYGLSRSQTQGRQWLVL